MDCLRSRLTRRLTVIIGAVALGVAVVGLSPPPAAAQNQPGTNGAQGGQASDKGKRPHEARGQSRKPEKKSKPNTKHQTPLHVVPMPSRQGRSAVPTGIRVQQGPDGKPLLRPDGKPLAALPGTPPAAPGPSPTLEPGGTLTMDFRGSDIANVLKFFAMATNWQIVPDANLTGPVTIISPKPLTIDQAFEVLQSTLEVRGFSGQLEQRGTTTILKIVPLDRAVQSTSILKDDKSKMSVDELKNQVITQVIPIDNVDAKALATELNPLINKGASLLASAGTNALIVTDTASNVQRIGELVQMLDRAASNNDIEKFALKHADATTVADALNNLFGKVFTRGKGAPPPPGQPQPPPQIGPDGKPIAPQQERGAVVAVADTRTNSVFVVASKDNMERVKAIIQNLDDPEAAALHTKYVKMQYADAVDVADTINSVLSGLGTPRRGTQGASFQQRVFGGDSGGGGQQGQGVASTDPFAKVVANARTNSLIVTATDEKMKQIDDLIAQLDVEVPVESTTFVIPLKNAQAEDVAYTLGQAFGTGQQQGYNPFGFFFFGGGGGPRGRQRIQRRQGQQRNNNPFGRAAALSSSPPDGQEVVMNGVHGTLTPTGFVPDEAPKEEAKSRGQFYYDYYGGGRRGQRETPQYGRGQAGSYVNLLQLRNNVGVTPDLGSNSLIITTTPDNMKVLREIIEALDIVPRQVMIEVIIAEATLDATQKLGFQFDAKGIGRFFGHELNLGGSSNFPLGTAGSTSANITTPINPGAQFGVQAMSGKFNALVQALATDNRVRILSTPKIFTSNNQEAEILITTNIPYVTNAFSGGFNFGSNVTYDFLHVGVDLDVTPRITKDGLVTIDVLATASELLGFDVVSSTVDANGHVSTIPAPRTSERTTDTSVSVRDGEIIALGGLMRDTKTIATNKIPLLGDIPLLGHIFRSTTTTSNKTELMIFMIPHVVDGDAQNRALVEEQSKNIRKIFPDLQKQQPMLNPENTHPLPDHKKPGEERPKEEKKP